MVPLKKGAGLKRKKSKNKNIFQSLHFQVPWFFFSGTKFLLSPFSLGSPVAKNPGAKTHTSAPEQSVPNFKALDPSPLKKTGFHGREKNGFRGEVPRRFFGRQKRQSQNSGFIFYLEAPSFAAAARGLRSIQIQNRNLAAF